MDIQKIYLAILILTLILQVSNCWIMDLGTMKGFKLAFLAVGAIIGAFVRYRMTESSIVFGGLSVNILLVNVIGSFILGAFSVV